jgi:spermidine/putrescine transport system permease protein
MAVRDLTPTRRFRLSRIRWPEVIYRLYILAVLGFVFLPIVVTIRYAFGTSRYFVWPPTGFTLVWFDEALGNPLLLEAFKNSLIIAFSTMVLATALGTVSAFGMARVAFKGKQAINGLFLLPIVTYGIIAAVSLLIFFNAINFEPGVVATILGHTTFLFPFVLVVVSARLVNFDVSLEEAAMDLGARPVRTFFDVTLPLISPAIIAGALFVFTLSFDDFILSFFLIGNTNTMPTYIYGLIRYFMTPAVNAAATMVIGISMILAIFIGLFFGDIQEIY